MPPSRNEKTAMTEAGISIATSIVALFMILSVTVGLTTLFAAGGVSQHMIEAETHEKAVVINRTISQRAIAQLRPVEAQVELLAELFGELDVITLSNTEISYLLYASLAAAPQISSVALVDADLSLVRVFRNRPDERFRVSNWSDDHEFAAVAKATMTTGAASWGEPFFAESSETTLLSRLIPLRDTSGAEFIVIATVDLTSLSAFLAELAEETEGEPFILYGEDAVLAHPGMAAGVSGLSDKTPLPPIDGFSDEKLRRLWRSAQNAEPIAADEVFARTLKLEDEEFYLVYDPVSAFGATPWYIGVVFDLEGFTPQLLKTPVIVIGGIALLVAAALASLAIGRAISWPIRSLSAAARQISRWEVDEDSPLRQSRFREINEASSAFAAALRALRSLQLYLPKTLPQRLVTADDPRTIKSESRQITVLFTDIQGFTPFSEEMPPAEVAAFLNAHFALISSCIWAEDGVVDKFIGDSVMAFWGGLQTDDRHAAHACRAAIRIRKAIEADNAERRRRGEPAVRLRIGIHSGEAVVGNIGAPGRANFTVIGDTVNISQRLEALARQFASATEDVVILISGDTARKIGDDLMAKPCGRQVLRGRRRLEEVYLLGARPET
ncbi:hypothetical protein G5B40_01310 [Pikeienuella piscinae]|uniref:Adenylate cyclase n=1 Tax=Pikeienuella piscinae TaxID=2748098 RepID=A0A7L5BU77_9RHOB|nr:adenylate/guanylate cyclase domain-containing protein [Pikeienuella piscinae]QIE54198.1 hypothetical protein G5B40_01310 [Pikeienuella piscinae]